MPACRYRAAPERAIAPGALRARAWPQGDGVQAGRKTLSPVNHHRLAKIENKYSNRCPIWQLQQGHIHRPESGLPQKSNELVAQFG